MCGGGGKMECEQAPVHSGSSSAATCIRMHCERIWRLRRASECRERDGEVRERVFEFIPRMEVEDLGAKRHSEPHLIGFGEVAPPSWRSGQVASGST